MTAIKVDGQDVGAVYAATRRALEHARSGKGPVFLHCDTYRLRGHYIGDPQVYRSKEEQEDVREHHDPITLLREALGLSDEEFDEVDGKRRQDDRHDEPAHPASGVENNLQRPNAFV